jgi:penicillin-binding protein 1A
LARNLYFSHKQTLTRKLKEFITAIQIERHYSKREILEMYLTQTYFGAGAYGIQAAAQKYFGKNIENLNLEECALLVAILKAPSRYSPIYKPETTINRRNLVLSNMYRWGFLDHETYLRTIAKPIELNITEDEGPLGIAPYFTEYIRQQLEKKEEKYGFDYYHDGLTVYTTLDSRLQAFAEKAVADNLPILDEEFLASIAKKKLLPVLQAQFPEIPRDSLNSLFKNPEWLKARIKSKLSVQVAFIALKPGTGEILALVGGRDFLQSKFNRAVQTVRQPGSAFKPFVYLSAIDNGYPPTYRLLNQDVVIIDGAGNRWAPHNYDYSRGGLTTLREGLKKSLNLVTIRLVQEVVPPKTVVEYAHKLGISTNIDAVDAIALGPSGVIPLELVAAYSAFDAGGVWAKPYGIIRIEDKNGNNIEKNTPQQQVVISEQTAYLMTNLLETVINAGTGGSVRWKYGFQRDAAGKTGTTNEFTDAWFIGYTPQICAGVWVGLDDPSMSLGEDQSGNKAALPIWAEFMVMVHDSLKLTEEYFKKPTGIISLEVCSESYDIATKYCPKTFTEFFLEKYAPADSCKIHCGKRGRLKKE